MVVTAKEAFHEINNEYLIYEFNSIEQADKAYDDLVFKHHKWTELLGCQENS